MNLSEHGDSAVPHPAASQPIPPISVRRAWDISGLTCIADAVRLEHRLLRIPGVLEATVNPVAGCAYVTFDGRMLDERVLRSAILRFGYGVS